MDLKISLGDFIVSGGELPCLMICDSILRLIPGALGSSENAEYDSFAPAFQGQLMHPLYTKPAEYLGLKVPEVLLNGNHKEIDLWRKQAAQKRRP